jgi:hypothetical protein
MVAPGKEKFFVIWLRRYFKKEPSFKGRTWEDKLPQYLDILSNDAQIALWQVDQAEQAVRLYFFIFYVQHKKPRKEPDTSAPGTTGLMVNRPG